MKALVVVLAAALLATPAVAETIRPADAKAHAGQTLTVEGMVSNVHTAASGTVFLDMGGRYPDNAFAVVIFAADADKFPDVDALAGKTVEVSGTVRLYRGKPEIVVKSTDQIKAK